MSARKMSMLPRREDLYTPNLWHSGWTALLIASFLICIYSLTYNGKFRVDDEHILASRAQSLALRGELNEPQVFGNLRVQSLTAFGDQATQIEPLISIFGAALYRVGLSFGFGGAQSLLLLNLYSTAISAGLIYLASRLLSTNNIASIASALFFGLGSMAWPYAIAYFRDSLAMLFVSLCILGLVMRNSRSQRCVRAGCGLIVAGLVGGILAKNSVVLLIPFVLLMMFVWEAPAPIQNLSTRKKIGFTLIPLAVILSLVLLIPSDGPLARFSLDYYLSLIVHFLTSMNLSTIWAFLGPVLSPSKSIFLFTPALFLLVPTYKAIMSERKNISRVSIGFLLSLCLAQALFYRELWAGTFGWGLRHLLPALPGLFLLVACSLEHLLVHKKARWTVAGLFFLSILIQLSAAVVAWASPLLEWQHRGLAPYSFQATWNPRYLSIPYHLTHLFTFRPIQIAWMRTVQHSTLALLVPISGLFLAIVLVVLAKRKLEPVRSRFPSRLASVVVILVWIFPLFPNLLLLKRDPYWLGHQRQPGQTLRYVSLSSREDDVVLLDSYGTPLWNLWMNRWDRPVPYYALPFEIPSPDMLGLGPNRNLPVLTEHLLEELAASYERIWYVASTAAPDYLFSGELVWLESRYRLEDQLTAAGDEVLEIRLYNLSESP